MRSSEAGPAAMVTARPSINRDLMIVMAGRVLQMAVLLLMLRAMTTRLSPLKWAITSLLMSIATLFTWIFISPVGQYVNRHTHEWREKGSVRLNYGREGFYVLSVSLLTALTLTIWQALFQPSWADRIVWLGPLAGLYIVFSVGNQTIIPAINLFGKRVSYALLYVGSQILCLACAWAFTAIHPTGEYWFAGQAIGFAAGGLLAVPIFLKTAPPGPAVLRGPICGPYYAPSPFSACRLPSPAA